MVEIEAEVGSDNEEHDERVKVVNKGDESERESNFDVDE